MQGLFRSLLYATVALVVVGAVGGGVGGCGKPTEVVFHIDQPTNDLLNPFKLAVSDYVLKSDDGTTLSAVSAGAAIDGEARLALGVVDPKLAGDLRLDVLSGSQLVGSARVLLTAVENGKTLTLEAEVRKPLVVVGSASVPEPGATGTLLPSQLLDSTTSSDLVPAGVKVPSEGASGFTSDGRTLFVATSTLTVVDTGSGAATGTASLEFAPSVLALAPNDAAMAVLERASAASRVLLYTDVPGLIASPGGARPIMATVTQGLPRAAHFSPDGATLYVLVEAAGDEPCTGMTAPMPNSIVPIDRTGAIGTEIKLPSYVADFAVDKLGRLVLADAGANQISVLTLGEGSTPAKLYDAACPTALRLLGDQVFAVTDETTMSQTFAFLRGRLDGSPATKLPIARPVYVTQLNDTTTRDKSTFFNLEIISKSGAAQEMAISPDGSRAVIAMRARFQESGMDSFSFAGLTCGAGVDIIGYGLYSVDLVSGVASYVSRAEATIAPANPDNDPCVVCTDGVIELDLFCPSNPGDRAAGLSAAFVGPP